MKDILGIGAVLMLTTVGVANAGVVGFTDRAVFAANTGTATETVVSAGPNVDGPVFNYGDLTFTATGSGNSVSVRDYAPTYFSGRAVAFSFENFTISLANPVFGFGFDVVEPTTGCGVPTCLQSTFSIDVLNAGALLDSFSFSPSDDQLAFFGVAGDMAFDTLVITETTGSYDDEYFGNFIATEATAPVPLPAALPLLLAGIGGLGLMVRRRKS